MGRRCATLDVPLGDQIKGFASNAGVLANFGVHLGTRIGGGDRGADRAGADIDTDGVCLGAGATGRENIDIARRIHVSEITDFSSHLRRHFSRGNRPRTGHHASRTSTTPGIGDRIVGGGYFDAIGAGMDASAQYRGSRPIKLGHRHGSTDCRHPCRGPPGFGARLAVGSRAHGEFRRIDYVDATPQIGAGRARILEHGNGCAQADHAASTGNTKDLRAIAIDVAGMGRDGDIAVGIDGARRIDEGFGGAVGDTHAHRTADTDVATRCTGSVQVDLCPVDRRDIHLAARHQFHMLAHTGLRLVARIGRGVVEFTGDAERGAARRDFGFGPLHVFIAAELAADTVGLHLLIGT